MVNTRYVDLIINEHSRDVFRTRSKIIQGIGDCFLKQNFMEVEAPMLQVIPSGATARPFVPHHNALDINMILKRNSYDRINDTVRRLWIWSLK